MPDNDRQPEFLTVEEAAKLLRTPRSQLDQWRFYQAGPPYVKLRRRVIYPRDDLMRWLRARKVVPRSD